MRAATVMLAGFFVVVGGAIPTPLARMHPPGMDVTKPEKPHYVLLRRKPELDRYTVQNFLFFNLMLPCQKNKNWECQRKVAPSAPSVYPPWSVPSAGWEKIIVDLDLCFKGVGYQAWNDNTGEWQCFMTASEYRSVR